MVLKFRLFLSYLFFAAFIFIVATYLHVALYHESKQVAFNPLGYYILIILCIIFISVFFAYLFSKKIANLSEQLKQRNTQLDRDIKQKTDELDKSLKIINKYVIRSTTDTDGIITDVSEAFCNISGYSKAELIGQPHSIVRHPDMTNDFFKDMWTTIASGEAWSGIIQNKTKDGGSYWVKAFIEPDFNVDGKIKGYTAIRHNITSEILLESQIKQNNAIISFANSAIGTIDLEGNFISVNGEYTKLFGYTQEEFIQKNCIEMTIAKEREQVLKILEQGVKEGIVSHVEKTCIDKFGNQVHVDMSLNKLPDGKSFVVVVNSLEDKKKLEKINSSLTKQVEQEVQKNLVQLEEIQHEQLKHAKLSSIGLVAAGVIHEINTPLTYIKGNLEIFTYDIKGLPSGDLKNNLQIDIKKINEGIARIENIIKSMREISGISSETKKTENIYDTLITALTILNNTSKLVCDIYINDQLFNPTMDKKEFVYLSNVQKQRVEQVWIVIINNALDELIKIDGYENRKLAITIEQNETNIIIKFQDNAGGIATEILPKIFEPLTSTKESGGIGIGLNIAKQIIVDQGGDIIAYNKEKGAVFEVKLPFEDFRI